MSRAVASATDWAAHYLLELVALMALLAADEDELVAAHARVEDFVRFSSRVPTLQGTPFALDDEPFQKLALLCHFLGFTEVLMLLPKGNGKALDVDTPIPTPSGWTTMGALRPGDQVLGSDGEPTTVTAATAVMHGRPCYRITFSDGAEIVADGDHQWVVESPTDAYRPRTITTAEMVRAGVKIPAGRWPACRWRIRTAARRGPAIELPIDPYVLGAWLGDGAADCGRISVPDQHIWDRIVAAGYELGKPGPEDRCLTRTVLGLKVQLKALGLISDKRIPEAYLAASFGQRLELIRGMLDTDGTVSKAGQVYYSTSSWRLAEDFRQLAWSLGRPAYLDEHVARLDGRDLGPTWRITVASDATHGLLTLPAKADRQKSESRTASHRRVSAIEPIESVPVRCIQVDAGDSLYLAGDAGIPTHNTTLLALLMIYHLLTTHVPEVVAGASTRDQAGKIYREACRIADLPARRNGGTPTPWRVPGPDGVREVPLRNLPGYREIRLGRKPEDGNMLVLASDKYDQGSLEGLGPTLGIAEELHAHRSEAIYAAIQGGLHKRPGHMFGISTAGKRLESLLGDIRGRALKRGVVTQVPEYGLLRVARIDRTFIMFEWAVPDGADIDDMDVVKGANPASFVTPKLLRNLRQSPGMTDSRWKRNHCGQWTAEAEGWLEGRGAWDDNAVADRLQEGDEIFLGVDPAWAYDSFAIVGLKVIGDPRRRRFYSEPIAILRPKRGKTVSPRQVKTALVKAMKKYRVLGMGYDQNRGFKHIVEELSDDHQLNCVIVPMSGNVWVPLTAELQAAIDTPEAWTHPGDDEYTSHVLSGELLATPGGERLHGRTEEKVDALMATGIAHFAAFGAGEDEIYKGRDLLSSSDSDEDLEDDDEDLDEDDLLEDDTEPEDDTEHVFGGDDDDLEDDDDDED